MTGYRQYLIGGPRHGGHIIQTDETRNHVYFPVQHPIDIASFFNSVDEMPLIPVIDRDEYHRERMMMYPGFMLTLWVHQSLLNYPEQWRPMAVELLLAPHALPDQFEV